MHQEVKNFDILLDRNHPDFLSSGIKYDGVIRLFFPGIIRNDEVNPQSRWRKFTYEEIINCDKTSLDITWLKDKSLADLDNLPDPDVLAWEIVENLEAGLENFKAIIAELHHR